MAKVMRPSIQGKSLKQARGVTSGNTEHEVREGGSPWRGEILFLLIKIFNTNIYIQAQNGRSRVSVHIQVSQLNKKLSKIVDIRWDQVNCTSINITSMHIWGCVVCCGIHKSNWVV